MKPHQEIQSTTPKTIVIAEDDELQRRYFKRDIEEKRAGVYEIVGEANTGVQLLALWKNKKPDIIVTDLHMPRLSGYAAIEEIRKSDTQTMIIVLTQIFEKESVEALYPHVNTYLIKSKETPELLLEKIDSIALYKNQEFRKYILDIMKKKDVQSEGLSYREFEVCYHIKAGLTNKQITEKLFLSLKTVEKTITLIFKKFKVSSREDLIKKINANKQPWKLK